MRKLLYLFAVLLISGCDSKDVEYYKAHDKERAAMLDSCKGMSADEAIANAECDSASIAALVKTKFGGMSYAVLDAVCESEKWATEVRQPKVIAHNDRFMVIDTCAVKALTQDEYVKELSKHPDYAPVLEKVRELKLPPAECESE